MVGNKKFFLQAVEREKMPSWEEIFQSMTLYNTNKSPPRDVFYLFIINLVGIWNRDSL